MLTITQVQIGAAILASLIATYISAFVILRSRTTDDNRKHPCSVGFVFLIAPLWIIPVWIYLFLHTLGTLINKK
jgi:hypothetical protein